ncbi:hypothetical protein [Streptomyces phaeochromogenes]|uniref:hypothetical protein n=1 Tax=Streptomyces phaeochromogenes TaxID=1923 RepID=UPI00371E2AEB
MRDHYPVVCHRELRPRWRWSAWRERRHPLIAGRGQVLVHNVEGAYTTGTTDPARRTAVTLVDVRPGMSVSAHWKVRTLHGGGFSVTVRLRCTVVDPAEVARSRREGSPWNVRRVLAQDPRPRGLEWKYSPGDEDLLRLALTAPLQARPTLRDIAGVRVELAEVSVWMRYRNDDDDNEA